MTPSDRPAFGLPSKLLFGVGAAANAIKARGLSTFLLIFYNQVVGLPPQQVSAAIMIALVFDAFIDPTIGQLSDNLRSPWGRRHPFIYAAALPVAVAFFALWNPPTDWAAPQLFGYLLACLLAIRLFDTFFELPSSALIPELAPAYNERTTLISLRMMFGVVGGLGMTILAYMVFLKKTPGGQGILDRGGYTNYALAAAVAIFLTILISGLATHPQIPFLRAAPTRKLTLRAMLGEVRSTLSNRSFIVLTGAGVFTAIAVGMRGAIDLYFNLYFWELGQGQLSVLVAVGVAGSLGGVALATPLAARIGKKLAAISMYSGALAVGVTPIVLRLFGLLPPNGSPVLVGILIVETFINAIMAVMTGILLASMMADVVEDSEVKTGRRSEGLLMSADNLFKKLVSGVGVFITGSFLAFVQFPEKARPGQVDPDIIHHMGLLYLPVAATLYGLGIVGLAFLRITKHTHDENLRTLHERALVVADAEIETNAAVAEAGGAPGAAGRSGAAGIAPRPSQA